MSAYELLDTSTVVVCYDIAAYNQTLESRTQPGEGGEAEQVVWQLEDIEAGSRVDGLAVCCEDEVGRPAEAGVPGRIQVQPLKDNYGMVFLPTTAMETS